MHIKTIVSEEMQQNCYIVEKDGIGLLIDPGMDTFKILKEAEGIKIKYILLTHCHFDHIYSLNEIRDSKMVVGSEKCSRNILDTKISLSGDRRLSDKPCDIIMSDGEKRSFDRIYVKCIYTPGHTDGSVCYLIENNLFSGDTLFSGSVGRCDLPTGNIKDLENSVRKKLYKLPDSVTVYPGHGWSTSIGFEKKNNGYFTE